MKPIQLTIQAFGSYGQRVIIDFTKPAQNLFLITGDTGAGKTTIFDAIVYALYGDKSEKNANKNAAIPNLQSQFTSIHTTPFVELAFSERVGGQEQVYIVHRVPNHKRKARRGNKEVEEKESVTLMMPDKTDYPGNKEAVNEKLREIIGLTKEQFMQVGMIAQGDFMRILRAPTSDKREIFRRLFHTEIFNRIVSRLGERNSQQQKELNKILLLCQSKAEDVMVPKDFNGQEGLAELLRKIRQEKLPGIVDLESLQVYLQKVCEELAAKEKKAEIDTAKAQQAYDASNVALTEGRSLEKAFVQLTESEAKLQAYQAEAETMQAKEQQAAEIQAAYAIRSSYQAFARQQAAVQKTETEQKKQEMALPSLQVAAEQAAKEVQQAKLAWDEELAKFGKIQAEVRAAWELFADSEAKERLVQQTAAAEQQARWKTEKKKRAYETYEKQVGKWQEQVSNLLELQMKLIEEKQNKKQLDAYCEKINQGILLGKNMQQARKTFDKAQTDYLAVQKNYRQQQENYEAAHATFLNAQAGILAESLQDGQPCPVCGSTEHPHPHVLRQEQKPLAREKLEAMASRITVLNKALEKASADAGSAKKQYELLKKNFDETLDKLRTEIPGCQAVGSLNEINQIVKNIITDCEDAMRSLMSQVSEQEQVKAQLDSSAETLKRMQTDWEDAEKTRQEVVRVHNAAQETWKVLRDKLRYTTREEAAAVERAAETAKAAQEKKHRKAEKVLHAAQSALNQSQAIRNKCQQELPAMQAAEAELLAAYQQMMQRKSMAGERWQAVTAKYAEEHANVLLREVQAWKNGYHAARGSVEAAKANINGRTMPDIAALTDQFEKAQTAHKLAAEQQTAVHGQAERNRRVLEQLSAQLGSRAAMIKDAVRISNLYERLSGKRSGARMDIETYVQRYYLQQILSAANRRFRDMSGGQFELKILSEEEAARGGNHGLDLKVYHTVTGKERAIQTLSGGESFMAALSLALGMSDQIQANKASINLDMLFIDEGFGSLDDNSRNEAVRVLQRMAGGTKLIGIISHVSELKQAIDNQLVVCKDDKGSHAAWQIS